jgi:hypothetical protein
MTNSETERARLSRRADVERDHLLRVLDALLGRNPVERVRHRAKQIGLPIAAVAVAGTSVALVLSYRKHEQRGRARRDARLPVYVEIARGVIVSVATFVLAAIAKRSLRRLVARPGP